MTPAYQHWQSIQYWYLRNWRTGTSFCMCWCLKVGLPSVTDLTVGIYSVSVVLWQISNHFWLLDSLRRLITVYVVEWKRNVMAHAQKPDSVFQRNGRVQSYRRGCQFSRVLAFLQWGSRENDCSNTGWTVPSQAENCWLPSPFASFPFTSPPVRHRVPPDSVSTLQCVRHLGYSRVQLKCDGTRWCTGGEGRKVALHL